MRPCPNDLRRALAPIALALAALVAVAAAGCGGSERLETAPAQGTVTYNGQALEFGSVIFQPEKGPPAKGQIKDGKFVLSTYGDQDGAIVGKHKIAVTCTDAQRPGYTPPADQEAPAGKSLIPKKYTRTSSSDLTETVTEDGPNEFTITLTD